MSFLACTIMRSAFATLFLFCVSWTFAVVDQGPKEYTIGAGSSLSYLISKNTEDLQKRDRELWRRSENLAKLGLDHMANNKTIDEAVKKVKVTNHPDKFRKETGESDEAWKARSKIADELIKNADNVGDAAKKELIDMAKAKGQQGEASQHQSSSSSSSNHEAYPPNAQTRQSEHNSYTPKSRGKRPEQSYEQPSREQRGRSRSAWYDQPEYTQTGGSRSGSSSRSGSDFRYQSSHEEHMFDDLRPQRFEPHRDEAHIEKIWPGKGRGVPDPDLDIRPGPSQPRQSRYRDEAHIEKIWPGKGRGVPDPDLKRHLGGNQRRKSRRRGGNDVRFENPRRGKSSGRRDPSLNRRPDQYQQRKSRSKSKGKSKGKNNVRYEAPRRAKSRGRSNPPPERHHDQPRRRRSKKKSQSRNRNKVEKTNHRVFKDPECEGEKEAECCTIM